MWRVSKRRYICIILYIWYMLNKIWHIQIHAHCTHIKIYKWYPKKSTHSCIHTHTHTQKKLKPFLSTQNQSTIFQKILIIYLFICLFIYVYIWHTNKQTNKQTNKKETDLLAWGWLFRTFGSVLWLSYNGGVMWRYLYITNSLLFFFFKKKDTKIEIIIM